MIFERNYFLWASWGEVIFNYLLSVFVKPILTYWHPMARPMAQPIVSVWRDFSRRRLRLIPKIFWILNHRFFWYPIAAKYEADFKLDIAGDSKVCSNLILQNAPKCEVSNKTWHEISTSVLDSLTLPHWIGIGAIIFTLFFISLFYFKRKCSERKQLEQMRGKIKFVKLG